MRARISCSHITLACSYGRRQEFVTLRTKEQNGTVERVFGDPKEKCVRRHRFDPLQHTSG